MQIDNAVLEIMKDYVTTILSHGRAHARLQQLLDLSHDFVFVFVTRRRCRTGRWIAKQDGPAGGKMLHHHCKYRRL
jgi:hypothetical protein